MAKVEKELQGCGSNIAGCGCVLMFFGIIIVVVCGLLLTIGSI